MIIIPDVSCCLPHNSSNSV